MEAKVRRARLTGDSMAVWPFMVGDRAMEAEGKEGKRGEGATARLEV